MRIIDGHSTFGSTVTVFPEFLMKKSADGEVIGICAVVKDVPHQDIKTVYRDEAGNIHLSSKKLDLLYFKPNTIEDALSVLNDIEGIRAKQLEQKPGVWELTTPDAVQ